MSKDSGFDFSRFEGNAGLAVESIDQELLFAEISSAENSGLLLQAYELANALLKLHRGKVESEQFQLGLEMMNKILSRAGELFQKKEAEVGRHNLGEDEEFTQLDVLINDTTRKIQVLSR